MWLKSQSNFIVMDLSDTGISDVIPNWFWNLSTRISYLNLSHSQLHRKVPNMHLFTPLSVIYLGSNKFEGPWPRISSNVRELDGDISLFLCHPIGIQNTLNLLHLGENLLSGHIPDCWNHLPSLRVINLDDNNLTREIPSSVGSLYNSESLHLGNNNLSGEMHLSLPNCTMLRVIDLGLNKFVVRIPTWVGADLSNLMILGLHGNKINGIMMPNEIFRLAKLQILDVAHNNLSRSIPRCFNNFTAVVTKPDSGDVITYSMFANFLENAFVVTRGKEDQYGTILQLVKA